MPFMKVLKYILVKFIPFIVLLYPPSPFYSTYHKENSFGKRNHIADIITKVFVDLHFYFSASKC
jgi:hypothetical protein